MIHAMLDLVDYVLSVSGIKVVYKEVFLLDLILKVRRLASIGLILTCITDVLLEFRRAAHLVSTKASKVVIRCNKVRLLPFVVAIIVIIVYLR